MKLLLFLTRTDLFLQVAGLIVSLSLCAAGGFYQFLLVYYVVGIIQVVSFLAHLLAADTAWRARSRGGYARFLLVTLIATAVVLVGILLGSEIVGVISLLLGLVYLIGSPFVAVWYFFTCWHETVLVNRWIIRQTLLVK